MIVYDVGKAVDVPYFILKIFSLVELVFVDKGVRGRGKRKGGYSYP